MRGDFGIALDEGEDVVGDCHVVAVGDLDDVVFDVAGDFECEGAGGAGGLFGWSSWFHGCEFSCVSVFVGDGGVVDKVVDYLGGRVYISCSALSTTVVYMSMNCWRSPLVWRL